MIISASRRTDIPAFYSEWFVNRLKEGFVDVKNPMNPKQVSRILLNSEVVDCIAFWTKNANPMLERLDIIDAMGYPYYFQFTLTPYDDSVEKYLEDKQKILNGFKKLSDRIGKQQVIWRYDPVIVNDSFSIDYHLDSFFKLCNSLKDHTNKCIFSYVDLYCKTKRNAKGIVDNEVNVENMNRIAQGFSEIARNNHIALESCSEEIDLNKYDIYHTSCIDKKIIEDIIGCSINVKEDQNQRKQCGCIESIDIGAYDCCPHGCVYCYATSNEETVLSNIKQQDNQSSLLVGQLRAGDKITVRAVRSLKNSQLSLY